MVVDTMVFAYALIGASEFRDESLAVLHAPEDVLVPDSFRAEFANVLWQYIRQRQPTIQQCLEVMRDADQIVDKEIAAASLWERALQLAVEADHPAYDALFTALAERETTRVVTYDERLRQSFPDLTISPAEFLAN